METWLFPKARPLSCNDCPAFQRLLWIANLDHGLLQLRGNSVVQQIPWAKLGRKDHALALAADPTKGGLWLGFFEGGVAYFKDGQVRTSYTSADGLGGGYVNGLQFDRDGILWAATEGGLSRLKNGRFATLTSKNGLPCDAVHWVMEDDAHSFGCTRPAAWFVLNAPSWTLGAPQWTPHQMPKISIQNERFSLPFSTVPTE
jgi:ligand-binding sensor domain-containing protein